MKHYPMSKEQREFLERDLAAIREKLLSISTLLCACYEDHEPSVRRAEEVEAAVQRLIWALERQALTSEPTPFSNAIDDRLELSAAGG
jgi:hypothetical protein